MTEKHEVDVLGFAVPLELACADGDLHELIQGSWDDSPGVGATQQHHHRRPDLVALVAGKHAIETLRTRHC